MRKIIIIDDRPLRQTSLLGEENVVKLNSMEAVVNSRFLPESLSEWDEFDIIAVHRSLLQEKSMYSETLEYVEQMKKYLIIFSGGTSHTSLINDHILELKAVDLYNYDRLSAFILNVSTTSDKIELLELLYGQKWILSYLIKYQHYCWQYPESGRNDRIDNEIYDLSEIINSYFEKEDCDEAFVKTKIAELTQTV